jgi:polar amino acid transport system permease protein
MESLLQALPEMRIDWSWSVFFGHLPVLLEAARITVFAALAAFALAAVLGLPLALARDSKKGWVRRPAAGLAEFVRRTPLLVQIYAVYYALPGWGIVLPALTAGVLTLGVHYAAYVAEVYRAGLASVPAGQRDACRALGLPRRVAFFRVIAPQALRPIAPALGNHLIMLFKETPLLSAIAVVELLQRAKIIGSMTFRYTEAITAVGLIFLVVSLVSAAGLRRLERRLGVGTDPGRVP